MKSGTVRADQGHSGAPEDALLGRFHYLSTVSGGGYIGSWLSAWRSYDDFRKVRNELIGRPDGPDVGPPEVSSLRAYSNYLTPRVGIGSADAWTAVAIYARNLVLKLRLVILPVLCLALFGIKFIATVSVAVAREQDAWWPVGAIGLIGAAARFMASPRLLRRDIARFAVNLRRKLQRVFHRSRRPTTSINACSSNAISCGASSRPSRLRFCSARKQERLGLKSAAATPCSSLQPIFGALIFPLRMDRWMACPTLAQGLPPVGRFRLSLRR